MSARRTLKIPVSKKLDDLSVTKDPCILGVSRVRIKVIVNTAAGRGKAAKALSSICRKFSDAEIDFAVETTSRPGDALRIAREAAESGYDTIVAVGGDGTANEAANGIAYTGAALGVIPGGTGNDFAYNIGMPRDVGQACEAILRGNVLAIDVGRASIGSQVTGARVETRLFVSSVGVGFDGMVAREAKRGLRLPRFFGGKAIYTFAVLKSLFAYRAVEMAVTIDDGPEFQVKPLLVAIGNGKTYGGGMKIVPDAKMDDQLFDICVIEEMGSLEALSSFPRVFKGTHVRLPKTKLFRGKRLRIACSRPVPLHMDGEVTEGSLMEFELIPLGMKVVSRIPKQGS